MNLTLNNHSRLSYCWQMIKFSITTSKTEVRSSHPEIKNHSIKRYNQMIKDIIHKSLFTTTEITMNMNYLSNKIKIHYYFTT